MRITEAARRLDMTPRMLRYRESLGLLPVLRHGSRHGRTHRGRLSHSQPGRDAGPGLTGSIPASAWAFAGRSPARLGDAGGQHRQFNETDLAAVALGLSIERRYDISPVALAFGVRVLADPRVRAEVAEFGRRIGRVQSPPSRALDFEQERARRLLRLDDSPLTSARGASLRT